MEIEKAVAPLLADRLQRGRVKLRMAAEQFKVLPESNHIRIRAGEVDHPALSDDIVANDDGARTTQLKRQMRIVRIGFLVGIDNSMSNGSTFSLISCASVATAGATMTDTVADSTVTSMFRLAIAA
jgi:hypothetical protein